MKCRMNEKLRCLIETEGFLGFCLCTGDLQICATVIRPNNNNLIYLEFF